MSFYSNRSFFSYSGMFVNLIIDHLVYEEMNGCVSGRVFFSIVHDTSHIERMHFENDVIRFNQLYLNGDSEDRDYSNANV